MSTAMTANFPSLLQQFFVQRLMQQLNASPRTISAYRDSFRLLLAFAEARLGKSPTALTFDDLNASFILDFLNYLENERHNSIRSRNARFAAIRSFMGYVALQEPATLAITQSVLAISMKRFEQPLVGFLSRQHIEAVLAAPDETTWAGQRDRVMLATLYNTGARVFGAHGHAGWRSSAGARTRGSHSRQRPQGAFCAPMEKHDRTAQAMVA